MCTELLMKYFNFIFKFINTFTWIAITIRHSIKVLKDRCFILELVAVYGLKEVGS